MRDIKLNLFVVLFLLLFAGIIALIFFNEPIRSITRATQFVVSADKSLILGSKLQAQANGSDGITVTVFVRNAEGTTIENQPVTVTTTLGNFSNTSGTTDQYGRAVFTLTSSSAGMAVVSARANSISLIQILSVNFTTPQQ